MGPEATLADYSLRVMGPEYIRQYLERVVDSESGVPRSERDMLAFWINLEVPGSFCGPWGLFRPTFRPSIMHSD